MKLPDNINKITLTKSTRMAVFPPNGFIDFEEGSDGGGDNYGLYWAIGKENIEPIICHKNHEESYLVPKFPNLDSFLKWYYVEIGENAEVITSTLEPFFMTLYNKSRVLTKNNKTEDAIQILEKSIQLFAEFSDAWTLLADNYYKKNEWDKAEYASLNSIISNYAFGLPSKKAVDQFNKINPSGKYKDHPLVKRKEGLISGGSYLNPLTLNYVGILDAIGEFEELFDYKSALILEQNYAYMMNFEKIEIREKYNFNSSGWYSKFKDRVLDFYPERE